MEDLPRRLPGWPREKCRPGRAAATGVNKRRAAESGKSAHGRRVS